jgi:GNAT superfamily N-acetyltransferase
MSSRIERLEFRIAEETDFEAIHRLNYRTFVEEIPQHPPNASRRLVDRFHSQNIYVICTAAGALVGMTCGRYSRPFSLDDKVPDLDRWLPTHEKAVEIRLLAVEPAYRGTTVFHGLLVFLARHFQRIGCDLALISGTVRQLDLYRHLGFEPFGARVGSAEATYQPMFLTLAALEHLRPVLTTRSRR